MFTVRHVTVPVLAPSSSRDLRVLHVSDLHLMPNQRRKLDFIRGLADLGPDLVVNTGDNLSHRDSIAPLLAAFGGLRDVPGVFVFGSNDYYAPRLKNPLSYLLKRIPNGNGHAASRRPEPTLPVEQLRSEFVGVGWVDLTHRREIITVAGHRLAFRGTDDAHIGRDDYSTVAGPPMADAEVNIAVTHAPYLRLLDPMTADGMDLIIAGHTHGGQVCVPLYGALTTNCDLDTKRVKGLSTHTFGGHTSLLHVSAGLGTSPVAPYRFACRPEVTLLTLTARPVPA